MRRTASIGTSILAFTLVASVALASTISVADSFPQRAFDGNTGTEEWENDWSELPESKQEGVAEGPVQVVNSGCPGGSWCLAIMSEGLTLAETGAFRHADLSVFANATLSFKMSVDLPGVLNLTDAVLWVKASTDGPWTALRSYPLVLNKGTSQKSIPLSSGYLHKDFRVSFVITGLLDGDVLIDDVVISGSPVPPPTTTSTTSSSTSTTLPVTTTSLPITTTLPTITTTTLPGLLTTSTSTTTTTKASTNTTEGGATTTSTTSTTPGSSSGGQSGGSEEDGATTTTLGSSDAIPGQSDVPEASASSAGLREASVGIQASFDGGRLGNVQGAQFEVMGIAIEPNYSMAVEAIESSWVYLLVLILLIAAAIVSGLDRRRLKRAKHTDV